MSKGEAVKALSEMEVCRGLLIKYSPTFKGGSVMRIHQFLDGAFSMKDVYTTSFPFLEENPHEDGAVISHTRNQLFGGDVGNKGVNSLWNLLSFPLNTYLLAELDIFYFILSSSNLFDFIREPLGEERNSFLYQHSLEYEKLSTVKKLSTVGGSVWNQCCITSKRNPFQEVGGVREEDEGEIFLSIPYLVLGFLENEGVKK